MTIAALQGKLDQKQVTALGHQCKLFLWNKFGQKYPGDNATQQAEVELSALVTSLLKSFGIDFQVTLYIRRCKEVSLNVHVMDGLPSELQMLMPGCPYCQREQENKNAPKSKSAQ